MKRITLFTLSLVIASSILLALNTAYAEDQSSGVKSVQTDKPEKQKKKTFPFNGKVESVDKTGMKIILSGKNNGREFLITSNTKFTKNGQPATIEDITVGEKISGLAQKNEQGVSELVSVNLSPGQDKETKKSSKSEKKSKKQSTEPKVEANPTQPMKASN